ncbi:hypothetical protein GE061_018845 [Apolygus lucorum]|uniref:Uncharacterized protein n=1 Tax=Apolygus lucorum TaxID=248454 RepID=A0A6A4JSC3_APOLU|nr:hypothetical protein GE061_018845 [Apolygus lucorum]
MKATLLFCVVLALFALVSAKDRVHSHIVPWRNKLDCELHRGKWVCTPPQAGGIGLCFCEVRDQKLY